MSSRAERRQHNRGGSTPPPPRRDPMRAVYIAFGAVVVIVIAVFGFMNWRTQQRIAAANATPTPAPSTSATPAAIQLAAGQEIGAPYFKAQTGGTADTAKGGRGQDIDGIQCAAQEYAVLHIHTQLSMFVNGKQIQVPKFIGAAPTAQGGCLYWIHTHNADGIIHVEAPQIEAPGGGDYKLGTFFDIWGQPLTRDNVAGIKGPVTAFVNGAKYDGDLREIPLKSHQRVVLEMGTPVVPAPNYVLPPGD
jgi:hypothetical protein